MNAVTSHKDLIVWKKALSLAGKVYAVTSQLPSEEREGLGSQLRLAAVSIPSRIAEGSACGGGAEFMRCLHSARASLSDLETHVLIAIDQGFIDARRSPSGEIMEVGRLLADLIRSLSQSRRKAHARACAPAVGVGAAVDRQSSTTSR